MTTVRTIKLKRNPQVADTVPADIQEGAQIPEPAMANTPAPDAVTASMRSLKATAPSSAAVSTKSYLWFMVMAILAVLGIGAIIGLQYSEWSFYAADPSVWLKK